MTDMLLVEREGATLTIRLPRPGAGTFALYKTNRHGTAFQNADFIGTFNGPVASLPNPAPNSRLYFWADDGTERYFGAERRVNLEGCFNCRDLGGYPAAGGRQVAWGQVFRSDALHKVSGRDIAYLEQMGIRSIIDFRAPAEAAKAENQPIAETKYYNFNPHAEAARQASASGQGNDDARKIAKLEKMAASEEGRQSLAQTGAVMVGQMRQMVTDTNAVTAYHNFFEVLLNGEETAPLIFHCQGGKDRTGWGAALFLFALGVPEEVVAQDYMLSREMGIQRNKMRMDEYRQYTQNPLVLGFLQGMQETRMEYLSAALDEMHAVAGTAEQYLGNTLGVGERQRMQLQRLYLV